MAVLTCLKAMPFQVGKSGLTKVLAGSIAASVKGDRVPQFGALEGLPQGKINALIDRLIEDGFVHRDETSEYRLLSLTPTGRAATLEDLAAYEPPPTPPPAPTSPRPGQGASVTSGARLLKDSAGQFAFEVDEADWTDEQRALLTRLKAWRGEQSRERAVPPYIIAHDRMLQELVVRRPASQEELLTVKGFGPAKVETYGDQVLALLREA